MTFPEPTKIMLAGDWHGNGQWGQKCVQHARKQGVDVIVHLGDFGWWLPDWDGHKYLRFLQSNLDECGITLYWVDGNHECVDHLTRAVTRRGFMSVDQLRPDDEVLSADDDGNALWLPIDGIVRRPYNGPMYAAKSRGFDMLVTPGHRVVGLATHADKWLEFPGRQLGDQGFRVVSAVTNTAPDYCGMSDDMLRLYAWCLTDAHHRFDGGWHFFQRQSAAHRITDLLDRIGLIYSASIRHRDIREICGKALKSTEPEVTVRLGVDIGRSLPWSDNEVLAPFVRELSERQVAVFLDELVYCDGSIPGKSTTSRVLYGSVDDAWLDQLHVLLIANGFRISQSVFRGNDRRLNICKRGTLEFTKRGKPRETPASVEHYAGEVWCLQVANGRFFVERNGKTYLTGNCHEVIDEWLEATGGEPWSDKRYPNVVHLPRGFRWQWWNQTWLALGGAHSVDRLQRTPGKSWWDREHISWSEAERAIAGGKVDVMVTHDCPDGVDIPGIASDPAADRGGWPMSEVLASSNHRKLLRQVCDEVRPEFLLHGHYHRYYASLLRYGDGTTTRVIGLAEDGSDLTLNTMLLHKREDG